MNKKFLSAAIVILLGSAVSAFAADTALLFPVTDRSAESLARDAHSYRNWKISMLPVIAGSTLDATSSYGMRELNPVMASQDGRFGMKGTAIKVGATAGLLGVEYLVMRKNPNSSRILSKLNWAAGFVSIGFATHNFAIK